MFSKKIKKLLIRKNYRPKFAVLIDPDKFNEKVITLSNQTFIDFFLVGGSVLQKNSSVHKTISKIKKLSKKPVIIFPGDENQISPLADGILLLSLVSGRNPDYLIEKQVKAAPVIQKYKLPFLPTAYLLIDGNFESTTSKVTHTIPLSQNKNIIYNHCLASAMLGMQAIYLEAGSGAKKTIKPEIIKYIKSKLSLPLIVGGGINSIKHIQQYITTPVDCLVIGNTLEKNPLFLSEIQNHFQWK